MARAAAPMLRGLRGETRTTSTRSHWAGVSKGSSYLVMLRLLAGEFGFEGLLAVGDVGLVAGGIDKGLFVAAAFTGVLGEHVVVAAVGSEEDVAGEGFEGAEALRVV